MWLTRLVAGLAEAEGYLHEQAAAQVAAQRAAQRAAQLAGLLPSGVRMLEVQVVRGWQLPARLEDGTPFASNLPCAILR